jgi:hypothetical protein
VNRRRRAVRLRAPRRHQHDARAEKHAEALMKPDRD